MIYIYIFIIIIIIINIYIYINGRYADPNTMAHTDTLLTRAVIWASSGTFWARLGVAHKNRDVYLTWDFHGNVMGSVG